jgi:hypothetical protein
MPLGQLPAGATGLQLGEQRLKDLYRPLRVWQFTNLRLGQNRRTGIHRRDGID